MQPPLKWSVADARQYHTWIQWSSVVCQCRVENRSYIWYELTDMYHDKLRRRYGTRACTCAVMRRPLVRLSVCGSILSTFVYGTRKSVMNGTRCQADWRLCAYRPSPLLDLVDVICPTAHQQRCADTDRSTCEFGSAKSEDPRMYLDQAQKRV